MFKQADLDIGRHTVDNFNRVLVDMTEYTFPTYAFCKQKIHVYLHMIKNQENEIINLYQFRRDKCLLWGTTA